MLTSHVFLFFPNFYDQQFFYFNESLASLPLAYTDLWCYHLEKVFFFAL